METLMPALPLADCFALYYACVGTLTVVALLASLLFGRLQYR